MQGPRKIYQELISWLYITAGTKENIPGTHLMTVYYCRNQGKYTRNYSYDCIVLQWPRKIYQELISWLFITAGTKENIPGTLIMTVYYCRDQGKIYQELLSWLYIAAGTKEKYTRNSSHDFSLLPWPRKIHQELLSWLYITAGTKEKYTRNSLYVYKYCCDQETYTRNSSHDCKVM